MLNYDSEADREGFDILTSKSNEDKRRYGIDQSERKTDFIFKSCI